MPIRYYDNPLEQEIYSEGYFAGFQDILVDCPYEDDTREWNIWHEGFEDGSYDS